MLHCSSRRAIGRKTGPIGVKRMETARNNVTAKNRNRAEFDVEECITIYMYVVGFMEVECQQQL